MHRRAEIVGRRSCLTANKEGERGEREGERRDEGTEQYQEHAVKWNEVPFVADKIILLPWPASLQQFEHNECGCWQTTKSFTNMQVYSDPSNERLEALGSFV